MRVQNIGALFYKQAKDCLKNLPVLILFFVYPIVALILTQAMKDQPGTGELFVSMFATMHIVFAPIVATSSFISEEKEKNTLRVLIMSNVTLKEYLLSVGGFVLAANLLTGSSFILIGKLSANNILLFVLAMVMGSLISIILGSCIGFFAKNASAANGLAVPIGIFFAFMPMLANFNKGIDAVAKFTYGGQLSRLMAGKDFNVFSLLVLAANLAILFVISAILYKRSLSEE